MRQTLRYLTLPACIAMAATTMFSVSPRVAAQQTASVAPHVLELLGILPAPTYDPGKSQIPRRRPGHPFVPPPQISIVNPDGVEPAPVDQAGAFIPVPDRWRIMETLGFKFPWYDPYHQNILKGDKPIDGKDHFLVLTGISETIVEPRSIPTPVGPQSTGRPGELDVFGHVNQLILQAESHLQRRLLPRRYDVQAARHRIQGDARIQLQPRQHRRGALPENQPEFRHQPRRRLHRRAGTVGRQASARHRLALRLRLAARRHPAVLDTIFAVSCSRTASPASDCSATATTIAGNTTWPISDAWKRT